MTATATHPFEKSGLGIAPVSRREATRLVVQNHYLHRKTSILHAYGLIDGECTVGVVTFGIPPSRHLQMSACPSDPAKVVELNRLWVHDRMPRNSESWFLSRALAMLPPLIVVSYADTAQGHAGIVYRASNFHYAGWTDMERKTPKFDYVTDGRHSRAAFRGDGAGVESATIRRLPKVKYWTVTGNARDRRELRKVAGWPIMNWKSDPPPSNNI